MQPEALHEPPQPMPMTVHAGALRWPARPDERQAFVEAARAANHLEALERPLPAGLALGVLRRRGLRLPVVYFAQPPSPFETFCLGLRHQLDGDGLVVVTGAPAALSPVLLQARVAVVEAGPAGGVEFELWRGLDQIDPGYRSRRVKERSAIFDEVRLEFACVPGERHVVRINGREFGGFQRSDQKFLRLLYLAVARAADPDVDGGGWVKKHRLDVTDRRDKGLKEVRDELRRHDHPGLTPDERAALVKSSPDRDGQVRLAAHPGHITFDASLRELVLVGERRSGPAAAPRTVGAERLARNQENARHVSRRLIAAAVKAGLPVGIPAPVAAAV